MSCIHCFICFIIQRTILSNNIKVYCSYKEPIGCIDDVFLILWNATGSTTLELAKLLSLKSSYIIFTDSLPVASVLADSNNQVFIFVDGQLMLQNISKQILLFQGQDGFSNLDGPTTPSSSDAFVDQTILKHAYKKYIVADHTKFSRNSLYKICDWSDVTGLITNSNADPEQIEELKNIQSYFMLILTKRDFLLLTISIINEISLFFIL